MPRFKEPALLHVHSAYSLQDAVPYPEEWLEWCLKHGAPGLGITDHGTAISFFHATRYSQLIEDYNKKNHTDYPLDAVSGIPGVELYVKLRPEDKEHYHITCWAVNNEGYYNLMKIASLAYNDIVTYYGSLKARVTMDIIRQYRAGIKFGTSCIAGPIGKAVMNDDAELAEKRFVMYKELFGDDLYVEFHPTDLTHDFNKKTEMFEPIKPTKLAPDGNQQKAYNRFLAIMIDKYGCKAIPVTDAHFIEPEDKIIQDCLLKNGSTNGWCFYQSYHQLPADEIFARLKTHLGMWLTEEKFEQWIANTHDIANQAKSIAVSFPYHLPKIEIPLHILEKTDSYDLQTYYFLMEKVKEHGRWRDDPEYIARFKKEIDVIMRNDALNFIPYFLVYEDISAFTRRCGLLQNIGRGSVGGSLLSYYLKITHIDPVLTDLPFERFLSHARIRAGSFPDIDIDLSDQARPLIVQHLQEKYGAGFAQIATFNRMKTKNAIKDAMFSLYNRNRNDPEVRQICDSIPDSPQGLAESDFLYGYTDSEGNYAVGHLESNRQLQFFLKQYPDVEKMVHRLIGMPRGWSRHASAFVISTIDIANTRVPTMRMGGKTNNSIVTTQYDADMVGESGLIKADILSLKTLTAVSDCLKLVKDITGKDYLEEDDKGMALVYRLPEDDAVYLDFYNKKTDSAFQFNTELVKGYLPQFAPRRREDLSILTALCRPGALDAKFTNDEISLEDNVSAAQYYIDVRNGRRKLSYLHPDLEPILKDTYGIFCYQEQVMKFLVELGGYSWEEADQIRAAIAKKKEEIILKTFARIRESTLARGWTQAQADAACSQIQAFSKYSFNRAHSREYAELGYVTVYLKHHHPLEWWTSVLNSETKEDRVRHYMTLLGDLIQPPNLKNPVDRFSIVGDRIAAPINAIKGIGPSVVGEVMAKGPFKDLEDFVKRITHVKVNIGAMAAFIKARAADAFFDTALPYPAARLRFIEEYMRLRGTSTKSKFDASLYVVDPLTIFLQERSTNTCFNRTLLSDLGVREALRKAWPGLKETGQSSIPLLMGDIPVVNGVRIARGLLQKEYVNDVAFIALFESSKARSGISKKTGRPWSLVSVSLSDGASLIEAVDWDRTTALHWPKDSVIYVRGQLKEGFRDALSITVHEIEQIDYSHIIK